MGDLLPLPRITLEPEAAQRFLHGSAQPLNGVADGRAVVFRDEDLLGIGRVAAGILQPEKVVATGVVE